MSTPALPRLPAGEMLVRSRQSRASSNVRFVCEEAVSALLIEDAMEAGVAPPRRADEYLQEDVEQWHATTEDLRLLHGVVWKERRKWNDEEQRTTSTRSMLIRRIAHWKTSWTRAYSSEGTSAQPHVGTEREVGGSAEPEGSGSGSAYNCVGRTAACGTT